MNETWYQAPCYSHTHLNGSYFWRWWWSWQDIHLGDLEILCLQWELFGNRYAGGGNMFIKVGYWGAVSFLPASGSSRSSLGWVRGVEIGFWVDLNTLPSLARRSFSLSASSISFPSFPPLSPLQVSLLIIYMLFSWPDICPPSPLLVSSLLYNCLKNFLQKSFWT